MLFQRSDSQKRLEYLQLFRETDGVYFRSNTFNFTDD